MAAPEGTGEEEEGYHNTITWPLKFLGIVIIVQIWIVPAMCPANRRVAGGRHKRLVADDVTSTKRW